MPISIKLEIKIFVRLFIVRSFWNNGNHVFGSCTSLGLATGIYGQTSGVNAVVRLASGEIVIDGSFITIGGQSRNHIAALDALSGAVTTRNPNASWSANTLAVSGGTVYVGGQLSSISG